MPEVESEAIDHCREILLRDPANFDALYRLGLALLHAGQVSEADDCLRKAETIEPLVSACGHFDVLLRQQGKYSPLASALVRYQEFTRLRETVAFIISYPKCGRTWLRLLLGKVLQRQFGLTDGRHLLDLRELTKNLPVPVVDVSHDDRAHLKPAADIERSKERYRGKKVILLVRDPRDVLVSYYFQYMRRGAKERAGDPQFEGALPDFIRHRLGGIDTLVAFYNVWASERSVPAAFMLLRYEDLHAAPGARLRDVIDFLGLPATDDGVLQNIVADCSFENMRHMEESNLLGSPRLSAPDPDDPETFKVRRGKVGGYRDYLGEADIEFLDGKIAGLDPLYDGYKRRR